MSPLAPDRITPPAHRAGGVGRRGGRRTRIERGLITLAALALGACMAGQAGPTGADLVADDRLGGDVTAFAVTQNAFGLPAPDLETEQRRNFEIGDSFFTQPWVQAPSSTDARDGLGPRFNANSCAACHVRDGRAQPPSEDHDGPGLLMRLSVPGVTDDGSPRPHPTYGPQLQDHALPMLEAEGRIVIHHEEVTGTYGDGTPWTLQAPRYELVDLSAGPLGDDTMLSPRIAPQMIGMGLLASIPEADVRAAADPDDADGDGISGRVNEVASSTLGSGALGRFGWKANVATVQDQVTEAFLGDIGITSTTNVDGDCTAADTRCHDQLSGDVAEIDDDRLDHVVFYSSTLAVPAMRDHDDPAVGRGADLFVEANCARCHTPMQTTGDSDVPALADQEIRPFTDLLLHDMGPDLADGRPDFDATGREWRTPPLWGIGLVDDINGHTRFLHDGRARDLAEAILWHGGEAEASRESFRILSAEDRADLLAFLESL